MAAIADTGAVMPFGTDAPVESYDPWPGIAWRSAATTPRWPAATPPFAPEQALRWSGAARAMRRWPGPARETDRGRLTVGQRADVVVIPAACGRRARHARRRRCRRTPDLVLIDGKVAFEA